MGTIITPAPAYQRPSGKLYLGTNQLNLVDGEYTLVELNAVGAFFTDGIEDTAQHRITPGQAGFYTIIGQVMFSHIVANKNYVVRLLVSGSFIRAQIIKNSSNGTYFTLLSIVLVKLSVTDYIELIACSNSGDNAVDILSSQENTFLSVQRVR